GQADGGARDRPGVPAADRGGERDPASPPARRRRARRRAPQPQPRLDPPAPASPQRRGAGPAENPAGGGGRRDAAAGTAPGSRAERLGAGRVTGRGGGVEQ